MTLYHLLDFRLLWFWSVNILSWTSFWDLKVYIRCYIFITFICLLIKKIYINYIFRIKRNCGLSNCMKILTLLPPVFYTFIFNSSYSRNQMHQNKKKNMIWKSLGPHTFKWMICKCVLCFSRLQEDIQLSSWRK